MARLLNRVTTVDGFTADLPVGMPAQQIAYLLSDQFIVICYQDSCGQHASTD